MYFRFVSRQRAAQAAPSFPSRQRFGIAPARFGEVVSRYAKADHLLAGVAGIDLGQYGQRAQNNGADQGRESDQSVERKADDEVKRNPGQIEQCDRPHAGEKRPQTVEMAQ